jgi:3-oxoacyl-[acyl-carrier protein] reductase
VSRLRRAFAFSAVLLCAAAGLTFGLAVPSAFADDPPPTTVPTPTLPAPDPAPPKPKPKPVSHPAPRPVRTTPVYHAPTPAPVVPSSSSTRPTVHTHVKPKKKVRHKKAVVKKKVAPTTDCDAPDCHRVDHCRGRWSSERLPLEVGRRRLTGFRLDRDRARAQHRDRVLRRRTRAGHVRQVATSRYLRLRAAGRSDDARARPARRGGIHILLD